MCHLTHLTPSLMWKPMSPYLVPARLSPSLCCFIPPLSLLPLVSFLELFDKAESQGHGYISFCSVLRMIIQFACVSLNGFMSRFAYVSWIQGMVKFINTLDHFFPIPHGLSPWDNTGHPYSLSTQLLLHAKLPWEWRTAMIPCQGKPQSWEPATGQHHLSIFLPTKPLGC